MGANPHTGPPQPSEPPGGSAQQTGRSLVGKEVGTKKKKEGDRRE